MTWRALPPPPADREPRRVAASLERIAASLGAPRPGLLTAVFAGWEELVGPDVAAHAWGHQQYGWPTIPPGPPACGCCRAT